MGGCACKSSTRTIEEEVQVLACDKDCRFDPRELRDLLRLWLKEHPKGTASKSEVMAFFTGARRGPMGDRDEDLLERTVCALDENHDGVIDFREAVIGLSILLRGDHKAKVEFLFHALDTDGSNTLSKVELQEALRVQKCTLRGQSKTVEVNAVQAEKSITSTRSVTKTVDAMFETGDLDEDGVLSFDEFVKLVESSPRLQQHFSVADAVSRFNGPDTSAKGRLEALGALAEALDHLPEPSSDASGLDPKAAARILSEVPGLSPVAIGEFLGSRDADGFVQASSNMFFASLEFQDMTLDQALRGMSRKLCLPRESQQIDRIVQVFAETYCRANPGSFPDEDSAYLTAFAIVMLNADAHTSNVKKKMTQAEFVKNCRLATPSIEASLLEGIYDRVTSEEITLGAAGSSSRDIETLLSNLGRSELSAVLGSLLDTADGRERSSGAESPDRGS